MSTKYISAYLILSIFLAFVIARNPIEAQQLKLEGEVANEAAPSVVRVSGYKSVPIYRVMYQYDDGILLIARDRIGITTRNVSSGSAFFVSSDGYLVTNNHVVNDSDTEFSIQIGGIEQKVSIVHSDPINDLAVLKVSGNNYPAIALGEAVDIKEGESVVAMGNALGKFIDSFSTGEIVALNRNIVAREGARGYEILHGLIETNAKIYPGDSGGPLLNEEGKVIGVNVATALGEKKGFAIPVDVVKEMLEKLKIDYKE